MQNDECKMQNERRLIDANELIRIVRSQAQKDPLRYPIVSATLNAVASLADALEAVDAVEVVRCKDCKHRGSNLCPMETIELYPWFGTKNDAFCSYGERR